MRLQRRLETGRKYRDSVFVPFAASDSRRLHPQALDDAQPRTVQQFHNNLMNSGHRTNDPLRLIPSQDNRNLDLLGRPFGIDFLVQWLLEYMFVEKDQRTQLRFH